MNDGHDQLYTAIFNRLQNSADKIIYPVLDSVPDNQKTDYIQVENVASEDASGKNCPIQEIVFNFACWTKSHNKISIYAMFKAISESLTFANSQTPNPLIMDDFWFSYSVRMSTNIVELTAESYFNYLGILTASFRIKEK